MPQIVFYTCTLVIVLSVRAQGSWPCSCQRVYYVQGQILMFKPRPCTAALAHWVIGGLPRGIWTSKINDYSTCRCGLAPASWICGFLSTWWLWFFKNRAPFFPHYHTFTLHLEIKLGIRIKHRHLAELKILNLILLSLPLDRSTHLTFRSAYNHCKYKCTKITKSEDVKNCQFGIVNLNGE